jgi:hypothetical protein
MRPRAERGCDLVGSMLDIQPVPESWRSVGKTAVLGEAFLASARDVPWPPELERAYRTWPSSWLSPWKEDFFGRLSLLYGRTFLPSNLHASDGAGLMSH